MSGNKHKEVLVITFFLKERGLEGKNILPYPSYQVTYIINADHC
jgi:hypothetical protein